MLGYCWTGSTTIETSGDAEQDRDDGGEDQPLNEKGRTWRAPDANADREFDAPLLVAAAAGDVHRRVQMYAISGDALATSTSRTASARRSELDVRRVVARAVAKPVMSIGFEPAFIAGAKPLSSRRASASSVDLPDAGDGERRAGGSVPAPIREHQAW